MRKKCVILRINSRLHLMIVAGGAVRFNFFNLLTQIYT